MRRCGVASSVLVLLLSTTAHAQLRIVNWNTLDGPASAADSSFRTVFVAIGASEAAGISKRPDVRALQEQTATSPQTIANMLNGLYDTDTYRAIRDRWTDSDSLGLVYDSAAVELLDATAVQVGTRPALRGQFRPVGYESVDAEFWVYSAHLKAGRDYAVTRGGEAARLRLDRNNLGAGKHIVYAGDFNVYGSSEAAYQRMLSVGEGEAIDTQGAS